MNVAVINGKDIIRYLLIIITGIIISFFVVNGINGEYRQMIIQKQEEKRISLLDNIDVKEIINIELPIVEVQQVNKEEKQISHNYLKSIFCSQIPMLDCINEEEKENTEVSKNTEENKKEEIQVAAVGQETQVIESNNIAESYNNECR